MRIVETDNFCSDYPNEQFVNIPPIFRARDAQAVVDAINYACGGDGAPRFWKVVENDYVLAPKFEP